MSDMECTLITRSGDVLALQDKVELLTKVSALDAKCDDLESRSCRQNIRIVGVPEGETFFITNSAVLELLRQAFDLDKAPEVDHAHRSLAPKRGDIPRPIVASLHYYFESIRQCWGCSWLVLLSTVTLQLYSIDKHHVQL
ncbi:hypothetical protein AOLI_G00234390 [Acnodon oligacanthus]